MIVQKATQFNIHSTLTLRKSLFPATQYIPKVTLILEVWNTRYIRTSHVMFLCRNLALTYKRKLCTQRQRRAAQPSKLETPTQRRANAGSPTMTPIHPNAGLMLDKRCSIVSEIIL